MDENEIDEQIRLLNKTIDFLNALKQEKIKIRTEIPKVLPAEFEILKKLLESDAWAPAVDPVLICNSESEDNKLDRAEALMDLLLPIAASGKPDIAGKKFLDFGCGEGHVAFKSKDYHTALSVGHDLTNNKWEHFPQKDNLVFTNNFAEVEKHGLYDTIFIYDVLDHIVGSVNDVLLDIKKVLAPKGTVHIRTHPWCSRHGTHMYRTINKAYIHLVFSKEELEDLGYKEQMPTCEIIHPLDTYKDWFKKAGFQADHAPPIQEAVDAFFINQVLIADRIKANWRKSPDPALNSGIRFPEFQISQQFINWTLTH